MKKLAVFGMAFLAVLMMVSCQGPKGDPGNANVTSYTITVSPNDWYWDNTSWRFDVRYEAITSDITDRGAVLVYMDDGETWRQIPMTFYYSQNGNLYSSSLEVSTYDNGLSIFWTESDFYEEYRPQQHRFKIVVIAASYYNARPDVDYGNYETVKATFQIKDDDEQD